MSEADSDQVGESPRIIRMIDRLHRRAIRLGTIAYITALSSGAIATSDKIDDPTTALKVLAGGTAVAFGASLIPVILADRQSINGIEEVANAKGFIREDAFINIENLGVTQAEDSINLEGDLTLDTDGKLPEGNTLRAALQDSFPLYTALGGAFTLAGLEQINNDPKLLAFGLGSFTIGAQLNKKKKKRLKSNKNKYIEWAEKFLRPEGPHTIV